MNPVAEGPLLDVYDFISYNLSITDELMQYVNEQEVKKINNFHHELIMDGYLSKRPAIAIAKEIRILEGL